MTHPVVGNLIYTLTRDVGWEPRDGTTSICGVSPDDSQIYVLRVTSTVSWPARPAAIDPSSATTTISPPVGVGRGSSKASVPVTVLDPSVNPPDPVDEVKVLVDGTDAGSTNLDGCAFFLVDAGTHTVSLAGGPGPATYVDRQGNEHPTITFTVSAGGNVPVNFEYALAASLTVTASTPSEAAVPTGVPLTLGYQFLQTGTKTIVTGFPATIGSLFPDTYDLWTGDCEDADPASGYWSGGNRSSAAAPGTAMVEMGGVAVTASSGGALRVGATVVATHDSAWGTCPGGSTSESGLTLGTTDSAGYLASALPFGHWLVSAGGGTAVAVVVDPTVPNLVPVAITS